MIKCPMCKAATQKNRAEAECKYHAAKTAETLLAVLQDDMKRHGAKGVIRYVLAGQKGLIEVIPREWFEKESGTKRYTDVAEAFYDLLDVEEFSRDDLLLVAAHALVLAGLHDDIDEPKPVDVKVQGTK